MHDREFKITKAEEGAAFAVQVVPKSKKNEIIGKHGEALKIRLTISSAGKMANEALLEFLCEKLNVERSKIEIAAGLNSAEKMVVVVGMTPTHVEDILLG